MSRPPTRCPKAACRSDFINRVDSGFVDEQEYRDTYSCEGCGYTWENVFTYRRTEEVPGEEMH